MSIWHIRALVHELKRSCSTNCLQVCCVRALKEIVSRLEFSLRGNLSAIVQGEYVQAESEVRRNVFSISINRHQWRHWWSKFDLSCILEDWWWSLRFRFFCCVCEQTEEDYGATAEIDWRLQEMFTTANSPATSKGEFVSAFIGVAVADEYFRTCHLYRCKHCIVLVRSFVGAYTNVV